MSSAVKYYPVRFAAAATVMAAVVSNPILVAASREDADSEEVSIIELSDMFAYRLGNKTTIVSAKRCTGTQAPLFPQSIKQDFEYLVAIWRHQTGRLSSLTKKLNHWTYQRILQMGDSAVPHILSAMQAGDLDPLWFILLKRITKIVPFDGTPSVQDARDCWLAWGTKHGYGQCSNT